MGIYILREDNRGENLMNNKIRGVFRAFFIGLVMIASGILRGESAGDEETAIQQPVKVAIIGDTEKHLKDLDMLTVKLSEDKNIHVLERSDWDYLLRERSISMSQIGQSSVKIGKLLGADALIILTEEEIGKGQSAKGAEGQSGEGKTYLFTKLVAVKDGVILDSIVSPIKEDSETFSLADSIEFRFKPKLAKLADNQQKMTISMLNLRSAIASPELLTIEKDLNTIFAERLMREQNVLVSERWNIAEAAFEKNLEGKDSNGFKTGTVILDGTIELKDKDNIEIAMFITTPDGNKQEFKVTGKKDELGKIAEDMTTECLKVAKVAKKSIAWDKEKEADEYYKEAIWAFHTGLFLKAAQSAESAWALGCRKEDLTELRIKSYGNAAFPLMFETVPGWRYKSRRAEVDISKNDKHLDAAIMALEIYRHYIMKGKDDPKQYFNKDKKVQASWKIDKKAQAIWNLGSILIDNISCLIRYYYDQKCILKDQEKQALVKKLLLELNDYLNRLETAFPGIKNIEQNRAIIYAKFWCDTPEETMDMYEEILRKPCLINYRCKKYGDRHLRYGQGSHYPFFIDKSGKYDANTINELLHRFTQRLLNSNNKQLQLDGLVINFLFGTLKHTPSGDAYWFDWNFQELPPIYDFYKENKILFWNHSLYADERVIRALDNKYDGFAYEYVEGGIKNRTAEHIMHFHVMDIISLFYSNTRTNGYSSNLTNAQRKALIKELRENLTSRKERRGVSKSYLVEVMTPLPGKVKLIPDKRIPEREELKGCKCIFYYNEPKQLYLVYRKDDIWTMKEKDESGYLATVKYVEGIHYALRIIDTETFTDKVIVYPPIKVSRNEKLRMLYKQNMNYTVKADNQIILLNQNLKKVIKLDVNTNQIGFLPLSLTREGLTRTKWKLLIANGSKLYIGFNPFSPNESPSPLPKTYDSGILTIDLKSGENKLICSSRIKPAKTILDDLPYRIFQMIMLSERYMLIETRSEQYDADFYVLDMETKDIKHLYDMDTEFFKTYVKSYWKDKYSRSLVLNTYDKTFKCISFEKENIQKYKDIITGNTINRYKNPMLDLEEASYIQMKIFPDTATLIDKNTMVGLEENGKGVKQVNVLFPYFDFYELLPQEYMPNRISLDNGFFILKLDNNYFPGEISFFSKKTIDAYLDEN